MSFALFLCVWKEGHCSHDTDRFGRVCILQYIAVGDYLQVFNIGIVTLNEHIIGTLRPPASSSHGYRSSVYRIRSFPAYDCFYQPHYRNIVSALYCCCRSNCRLLCYYCYPILLRTHLCLDLISAIVFCLMLGQCCCRAQAHSTVCAYESKLQHCMRQSNAPNEISH